MYKLRGMIHPVVFFFCDPFEDIMTLADNPWKRNNEIEAITSTE